mgnify:FL=1
MLLLLLGLAFGEELACDFRGLRATIRYDAEGHITLLDGDEPLTKAQSGPIDLSSMAGVSCVGDQVRFVWGIEGSATMAVERQHVDFAPILDALASDRFDPAQEPFRRARYHGRRDQPEGVWKFIEGHQHTLSDAQRLEVARWLAKGDTRELLEAAWAIRDPRGRASEVGQDVGYRLAEARLGDDPAAAEALFRDLTETPITCGGVVRALEARGEKGPARKQRKHCAELDEPAEASGRR